MQKGSSSSSHPKEPRQSVQPPPKEAKKIDVRKRCSTMFSKRSNCILKKATNLSEDTSTPIAVIMFSPAGNPKSFGRPSIEEVFSMYLLHEHDVNLPMSPKEGVDWAERGDPSFLQPVHSLSRRNMQTGSSSSPPPRKPSTKHLQTPQISVQPLPKEAKKIGDRKRCSTMFSKRLKCILEKAFELNELTGAPVAVIMFSPSGKLHSFGKPSVEEVFFDYRSPMTLPTSRRELVEEGDPCATKEDCASLMDAGVLLKKSKDFENSPSVNTGASHESGVGADRDPEGSTIDGILSMLEDFKATAASAYNDIFEPFFVDCGELAAGGESSGVDSNSTCFDPDDYINLSEDKGSRTSW